MAIAMPLVLLFTHTACCMAIPRTNRVGGGSEDDHEPSPMPLISWPP
jgi:hypothetical protein